MYKSWLIVFAFLLSTNAMADSFRCKRGLVKNGDSTNTLLNKCGDPVRKYSTQIDMNDHGRRYKAGVTNWVYERTGKSDMIVSVRSGEVLKIKPD